MKNVVMSLILAGVSLSGIAQAGNPVPPAKIERASNAEWVKALGAQPTPYADWAFNWFEAQLKAPLPNQVNNDPEKLFVYVDKALEEAKKLESNGDVEEGTSYGLETFGIVDADVKTVLETILFRWGKPVGQEAGVTHPNDTVFGFREERATPEFGAGSFKTITYKRRGGIAQDMNDVFSLLVRGNETEGYALVGNFIAPAGNGLTTTTTTYITIILIRPLPGGKTDYRVAGMLTGQNYSFFGVEQGRKNFGFNVTKIREGQKDFLSMVKSLKETGKIPERKQ